MMHPFTKTEIYEALVERHTAAYQEKLDAGHVAIAGLGGLGSNVAFALARLGVGHLHLIDFDRVDLTNLNRQQYLLRHVGMYKTDALKEQLLQINPYLDITTDCVKVTSENLKTLFADADIICEAFDNAETKAMFVNGILECFPQKKLVCASGMAGLARRDTLPPPSTLERLAAIFISAATKPPILPMDNASWHPERPSALPMNPI